MAFRDKLAKLKAEIVSDLKGAESTVDLDANKLITVSESEFTALVSRIQALEDKVWPKTPGTTQGVSH